jgi:uncharacterized circularly permuted ATP-grasp superfamily protein
VAGTGQRRDAARPLLNAVLKDLYGPQTLLKDGSLPPALVYGHNNFLWPCQGINQPATPGCTSTPPISRARRTAAGG